MKKASYIVDEPGTIYTGCLRALPDLVEGVDYITITEGGGWAGPTDEHTEAARIQGIRNAWTPERRKEYSLVMSANRRSGRVRNGNTPEQKAVQAKRGYELGKSLSKPCTIDGITIYESKRALVLALGAGKSGMRHPAFRYV